MIIQRDARIITSAMNIQAWCQFFEASTRQTSSAASPMARRLCRQGILFAARDELGGEPKPGRGFGRRTAWARCSKIQCARCST